MLPSYHCLHSMDFTCSVVKQAERFDDFTGAREWDIRRGHSWKFATLVSQEHIAFIFYVIYTITTIFTSITLAPKCIIKPHVVSPVVVHRVCIPLRSGRLGTSVQTWKYIWNVSRTSWTIWSLTIEKMLAADPAVFRSLPGAPILSKRPIRLQKGARTKQFLKRVHWRNINSLKANAKLRIKYCW